MGSLTSCPGLLTAALFAVGNRTQHIINGYVHHPPPFALNDTIIVSFVKKKIIFVFNILPLHFRKNYVYNLWL